MLLILLAACRAEPAPESTTSDNPRQTDTVQEGDSPEDTTEEPPADDEQETGTNETPQTDEGEEPGDSAAFEGTVRNTHKAAARQGVAVMQSVRMARHEGFDRVVFAFDPGALPGYHLEYVDRPVRNCGEGSVVPIAGDAWLQIRLEPANAHTEAGQPTVAPRERRPGLPVLREAELTCDFEAVVTWVLGLASPNPYRVLELRNPPRLVVDVRH